MNICIVSTFDGTTDDFMEIFNWAKDKASAFATDMEAVSYTHLTLPTNREV